MYSWLNVLDMKSYYQSENISINIDGEGSINSVHWLGEHDNLIEVYTSVSFNGGYDWTEWKQAHNGSLIPDLPLNQSLNSVLLRYRVFLESSDLINVPIFDEITFNFEPVIVFDNKGDTFCTPEIWINKTDNGDFSLTNISYNNNKFEFLGLVDNETVYVNNENEYIESSNPTVERYSSFNDNYLSIPSGINIFRVNGSAKIQFRSQFKLI